MIASTNNQVSLQTTGVKPLVATRGRWTFIAAKGKESGRSVVFLFNSEVEGSFVKDGAKLGDMPINRKWGYMFEVGDTPDARTLAHELGHGRLTLRHTFATEHCDGTPGHTNNHNLMDYGTGTGLNRFQWEAIHNPALIGKVFQSDEDAAMYDQNLTDESIKNIIGIVRNDNISSEENSDLSVYALSSGITTNLELTSDFTLDYIEVEIKSGKHIGTEENPFLYEALTINPMEINFESTSTPKGQEGDFVKAYYTRYDKASPPATGYSESDSVGISFVVNKTQEVYFLCYLLNLSSKIEIAITNIESDSLYTLSSFDIDNGNITGYMLERPSGTAEEERTDGSLKRIPEGTYEVCYPYGICRPETTRENRQNELWVKTYGEYDQYGGYITREYVLIHIGSYVWNSEGCLLSGTAHQEYTLPQDKLVAKTGETYSSGTTMEIVTGSRDMLNNTLSPYLLNKINILKAFGIDRSDSEYLEIEIEINR